MNSAKRNYKDNTFCALFSEKENLIELYNAISGSSFDMDTPVEIVTLENTFFGDRENDLSFIIDNRWIILAEQQSTLSPNIPLRMLAYLARQYEKIAFSREIYSKKPVRIPTPELYVFYNGIEDAPVEQELKLSDAFMAECDKIAVEVTVSFINVNYEKGAELLKRCRTMSGYSLLIHMIREEYKTTGDLKTAIEDSIRKCRDEGILADFLKKHGGEVMSFLFEKLTREECEAIREADGFDNGYEQGYERGEADGYERGETAGYERGEVTGVLRVASSLKKNGMSIEEIVKVTGLEPAQIEAL